MRKAVQLAVLVPVVVVLGIAGPPGGGGHGSSGGGHASGAAHSFTRGVGGHGYSGPPAISGPAPIGASGSAPINSIGSLRPVYGFNGLAAGRRNAGPGRRWNNNPYGYNPGAFVMPFLGYDGYGDGGYYDSGYNASNDGPAPDYGSAPDGPTPAEQALGDQVQQLSNQIQDLRDQQQGQFQPQNAPPPPQATGPDQDWENDVPITLVLHSGQQLQVRNYAVTDGVFWDFSKHPAQKIPVAAIDVAASEKATEANGGDFPPISQ